MADLRSTNACRSLKLLSHSGSEARPSSLERTSGIHRSSEKIGPISQMPVIFPKRETSIVRTRQPASGPNPMPTWSAVGLSRLVRNFTIE